MQWTGFGWPPTVLTPQWQDRNLIWFLQICALKTTTRASQNTLWWVLHTQLPVPTIYTSAMASTRRTVCQWFLRKCTGNPAFPSSISLSMRHSTLQGKQWNFWISMYGQMKLHMEACMPSTHFLQTCVQAVYETDFLGPNLFHHVRLWMFTMTSCNCKMWVDMQTQIWFWFMSDGAQSHFLLAVHALLNMLLERWIG